MKVIDLLNKIAKGEELPKKIKIGDNELTLNEYKNNYLYDYEEEYWGDELIHWFDLNYELEIIEEDKEIEFEDIEEVEVYHQYDTALIKNYDSEFIVNLGVELLADKINDLIKNQKKLIEEIEKLKESK